VNHYSRRGRTTLEHLERLRQHTEVIGRILRDLWPAWVVVSLLLGVTLHQPG